MACGRILPRRKGLILPKQAISPSGRWNPYEKLKSYFGEKQVVPVYVELEDGEQLSRALARERLQGRPLCGLCRRFLADCADFSEESWRQLDQPAFLSMMTWNGAAGKYSVILKKINKGSSSAAPFAESRSLKNTIKTFLV